MLIGALMVRMDVSPLLALVFVIAGMVAALWANIRPAYEDE